MLLSYVPTYILVYVLCYQVIRPFTQMINAD